ncbi:MAG TPA: POTRA domain-containing protein [Verrucomicrobiae bacterium]
MAQSTSNVSVQNISGYEIETYNVEGGPKISMDMVFPILSKYTGPNVNLEEIVEAAEALQTEYQTEGYTNISVAIAKDRITNGVVTLNIFQAALPQIVVSGIRYLTPTNSLELPAYSQPVEIPHSTAAVATTNTPPPANYPLRATPVEQIAARAALFKKMAEVEVEEKDHRIHVATTNAGPRFDVEHYLILGNSVLLPQMIAAAITNIDGAFGTNVSFAGIQVVVEQLQNAYHDRGYATVAVTVPQQKLANATVTLKVLEGRLSAIKVIGNEYFSSNNIMRALPSLHNGILINAPVLQAELNRANANQDRQIYPIVGPGPEPGTSELTLKVKDRLPLHAKVDLDNQSSPGTPELRINASAVYDNLWQMEHSLGFQYGFSPEEYKPVGQWRFYDQPAVSFISGFYRFPIGNPDSLADRISANPGSFGYSEASRKFNLPPTAGRPDFTVFASRSTIDTGVANTFSEQITASGSNPSISRQDVEDSPTINEDVAGRFDYPLASSGNLQSSFSGGLDFKIFQLVNYKTNLFFITQTNFQNGQPVLPPVVSAVPSIVPTTENRVEYLPLSIHYNGNWHDALGMGSIGLGVDANLWLNSTYATTSYDTNGTPHTTTLHGSAAFTNITASSQSSGYWVVVNPSFSHTIMIHNWETLIRADGQWASEPLISPEQFGAGGVNSVRGYPEGDVFGDDGWHLSLEQQTPTVTVGMIRDGTPLTLRGSVYMDYANVYLIDPQGRPFDTPLWGTGVGFSASAGPHWQAQFLFSFPLLSTSTTPAYQPLFNFALTAQF